MVNYQNGKIYKIVCNKTNLVYYGSTTKQYLSERLTYHRSNYKRYLNKQYHFISSFKVLENNDYNIILVEIFKCNSKDELLQKERFYIENNSCVNKNIPSRTQKEYNEINKELIKEKNRKNRNGEFKENYLINQRKYYYENREKILLCGKIHKMKNKESIAEKRHIYYELNKEKISNGKKIYREENKEKIALTKKIYNEKNRETINAKTRERNKKRSNIKKFLAWLQNFNI